jgi:hypothetical protein
MKMRDEGSGSSAMPELCCAECRRVAPPDAPVWKADIGDDLRDNEPPEVVLFCPECWEREFGTP